MSMGTKGSTIIVIAFLHLNFNLKEHQHRETLVPGNTSTGNTVRDRSWLQRASMPLWLAYYKWFYQVITSGGPTGKESI